jgi:predicted transcriptional regulator
MQDSSGNYNIIKFNFSDSKIPEFKEVRNKPYIQFGEKDDYPEYLLGLYNKSAKHNAIINGKLNYIFGDGFTIDNEQDQEAQLWKAKVNRSGENLNDLGHKSIRDIEVFGGFYWQIIPDFSGEFETFHLPFHKVRSNRDNTEFYYKRDWNDKNEKVKVFPAFDPSNTETSIFFFREYRPGLQTYCLPSYIGSCNYIEADIEVSKHTLTNAKTGFSASKFINFYNGEPDEDKKKQIEKRFNDKFTGAEGKKILIGFNNDPTKKPTIDDLGASDISKEDFGHVDELITANIFAGHQITSPTLFGIQEPGKLGAHNELRLAYDIFKNTYVANKQRQFEQVINHFARVKGIQATFKLIPVDPVGVEFGDQTLLQAAPRSWLLEKMGVDTNKYTDAPVGSKTDSSTLPPAKSPTLVPEEQQMVNENIKNLTGRQHQQMIRIITQYQKGKINRQQATTLLKTSLGLSDTDIDSLLGMDSQTFRLIFSEEPSEEDVAQWFSVVGTGREDFEVVKSKEVKFSSDKDVSDFELNFYKQEALKFAETVSDLEVKVLDLVQKDKRISAQTIAQSLDVEVSMVEDTLQTLEKKGLLKVKQITEAGEKVAVRTLTKPLSSITRTIKSELPEIFIKYSYEVKSGVGPAIIPGTRPFCRKLVELDRFYSRTEIEQISERLGYSVWDRRGGFWNQGKRTSPTCRHIWKANVVIKKK